MTELHLYHGSQMIVEQPDIMKGKSYNDYGKGFYCTESIELAKEWACNVSSGGYANEYRIDTSGLSVLNLSQFHVLNWLTILISHRTFDLKNELAREAKEYLLEEFKVDVSPYDIIRGYRADDSYFAFASGFLNGVLSLEQLTEAMKLGRLGEQVVLKSEKAFENIHFYGYEVASQEIYYSRRKRRDDEARSAFQNLKTQKRASEAIYMLDILRERWKNDDVCL